MRYKVLPCEIEYNQAVKRMVQMIDVLPRISEAIERQVLIRLVVDFKEDLLS